jgi:amidase
MPYDLHPVSMPPSKIAHRRKQEELAGILARFPQWRLKESVPATQTDVSCVHLSELSSREREIISHDATALVQYIRSSRYTAVEIAEAYFHAAVLAHELTNCLSEIFFEEGLKRAASLDAHFKKTGELVGALHGVPCSVKNHIRVYGQDTCAGYAGWAFKTVSDYDALAVEALRKAGAVLYCKTTNPQTMMVGRSNIPC